VENTLMPVIHRLYNFNNKRFLIEAEKISRE
jgi:hypothetical protein